MPSGFSRPEDLAAVGRNALTDTSENTDESVEEGIEEAVFINTASSKYALDNTYGNIRLLFE